MGNFQNIGEQMDVDIPNVGESITEVTIASWLKKEGDQVSLDEIIAEIDSDKATFEIHAEAPGTLHLQAQEGDTIAVGVTIATIAVNQEKNNTTQKTDVQNKSAKRSTQPLQPQSISQGHPSPVAENILAKKGIDPHDVQGTGIGGKITKQDALKAANPTEKSLEKITTNQAVPTKKPNREIRKEKLSTLRKTIAKRLVAAKNEMAMLTTFNEVDMAPVMALRKKHKAAFEEKYDVKLGFISFFAKAVCMALQEWPTVNAMIDNGEIIFHDFCDISVAVATPRGLVVPVIRNTEQMTFQKIEKTLARLATKARENKLSIEEMTAGTFTITNGGIFGSMLSTPIINTPQSAILGMHNIVERPIAVNNEIVIKPIMYVALSYDHRIIDGREAVSFLHQVKTRIEDPTRLLVGV